VLAEAEALLGPSHALAAERRRLGSGESALPRKSQARTPWERYLLGRALLRSGALDAAAVELDEAVAAQPDGFWPNFYQGVCAYKRGRHAEAVAAFRVCLALAPGSAPCYHNRALALRALGRVQEAERDCDRALELDGGLAAAWVSRGLLRYKKGDLKGAVRDLERALAAGADPALAHYNLALVEQRRGDRRAALLHLEKALGHRPSHGPARALRARLVGAREGP
jgi:tetratricopeptide (TPR) repeat protein